MRFGERQRKFVRSKLDPILVDYLNRTSLELGGVNNCPDLDSVSKLAL